MKFIINLVRHPGTWTFLALLMVIIATALPFAAVPILITAAILTSFAILSSVHFLLTDLANRTFASIHTLYEEKAYQNKQIKGEKKISTFLLEAFLSFAQRHPAQLAIILIGSALFITALILTIGFLTGGFAFMAPVFAWLSAPFIAAAGSHISATALAFATILLAAINLPNTLKRVASWIDSFKYDFLARAADFTKPSKYYNNHTIKAGETIDFWKNLSNLMYEANRYSEDSNLTDPQIKSIMKLMPAYFGSQVLNKQAISAEDQKKLEDIIQQVDEFESDTRSADEIRKWWQSHQNLRTHALFQCYSYPRVISAGMNACIGNLFSSPHAEKCEEDKTVRQRVK